MTQDTLNKEDTLINQDTPRKQTAPIQGIADSTAVAMNAADQAMVDELDRVLRTAFGQQAASVPPPGTQTAEPLHSTPTRPVIASKPLPPLGSAVANAHAQERSQAGSQAGSQERSPILEQSRPHVHAIETPVMLPVSGPPSAPILRPRLGPAAPVESFALPPKPADATRQAVPKPQPPVAMRDISHEHAPATVARATTGKTQANQSATKAADDQPRRHPRPLPPVAATIAPVEPIVARRRFPWRPAVAVTSIVLIAAVGGQFALQWLKQPAIPMSDAPPVITAPVAPTGVAASPEIQNPPPVIAAPAAVPPPVATVAAPPVPAAPPTVETAGILGTPQVSPFDGAVPTRTVRTTVVAAASNGAQPVVAPAESKPAKPLSLTDKATWPEGASLAEPHPLPPRRK